MQIEDVKTNSKARMVKINSFLSEKYGFKIPTKLSTDKLEDYKVVVENNIYQLRNIDGKTPRSPELAKELLILEGVNVILEYRYAHMEIPHNRYRNEIRKLSELAIRAIELGDSKSEAIHNAMKEYRSGMLRFDDNMALEDITRRVDAYLEDQLESLENGEEIPESNFGLSEDDLMLDINESTNQKGKDMTIRENYVKRIRALLESEVEQAEVLAAAKGFAQEIQTMIEKSGRLTNEDLEPVVDQMRESFGAQEAASFQTQIRGEMESLLNELRSIKGLIDDSVQRLAKGSKLADINDDSEFGGDDFSDMGGDDIGSESELDADAGNDLDIGDELPPEPLGRSAKESIEQKKKVIAEKIKELEKKISVTK